MLPKTRKDAMLIGSNTYLTGRPCIHGHMSVRYVQSGSCRECINLNHSNAYAGIKENKIAVRNNTLEELKLKTAAREQLVLLKIRLYPQERDDIGLLAYGFGQLRFPMLEFRDFDPKLSPSSEAGGTYIYKFYSHAEDVEPIRDAALATFKKYPPDFSQTDEKYRKLEADMNSHSKSPLMIRGVDPQ